MKHSVTAMIQGWAIRSAGWFVLGCLVLVTGCQGDAEPEKTAQAEPEPLPILDSDVLRLDLQPWPTILRSQGSLHADEQSVVGAKVSGRVAEVHVDLGDYVRQGDPLVTLDRQEAKIRVMQAEAQLRQAISAVGLSEDDSVANLKPTNAAPVREAKAMWNETKSSLTRAARLRKQNAIAAAEYEQAAAAERVAESRYASALNGVGERIALIGVRQAELSLAEQQLADAVVPAPFDGYVQQRTVAVGTYVSLGQTIAVVVQTSPLRFRGSIPERFAQSIELGQEVRLQIESVGDPRIAKVSRISPALDQRSRTLTFEAEVVNEDRRLRAGLFAEAEVVIVPDAQALIVPESAIVEFAGSQKVWKVVDGVASEQTIVTTNRRDGQREVVEGLLPGDLVLIRGET